LLAGCSSDYRVGELHSESQSVELVDAQSVIVKINMGAGDLKVAGGAEKLLEADFNYNVARLKPEVEYTDGTLVVQQPEVDGLPVLPGISDFRNEWGLYLYDGVPINLSVNMGAGNSELQLDRLSLTGLDVVLGAGVSKVDLSSDWVRDLDVTIDAGATDLSVRLPTDVGVRVEVDRGAAVIEAPDLTQDENVYTNDAYGVSNVTLHVDVKAGIGRVNLELADN
jgi:hypothetical protein